MPVWKTNQFPIFRNHFVIPNKNLLRWFPGHMATSLKKMQTKLKAVDCVIEVHDARIPFSGRNPQFKHTVLGVKPHILVLNKSDLSDRTYTAKILGRLKEKEGIKDVIFTNCKDFKSEGLDKLIPLLLNKMNNYERYNRNNNREFGVMIIGVPNVGKSSLINALRTKFLKKGACAPVGAKAGVTRHVQTRIRISHEPPVFLYDTPGILTPNIPNIETGMKLAVCSTLQDHLIGNLVMSDFLIYWFNKTENSSYLDYFEIDEPNDNTNMLLVRRALKKNCLVDKLLPGGDLVRLPSIDEAARMFVEHFRRGTLGPMMLDKDLI